MGPGAPARAHLFFAAWCPADWIARCRAACCLNAKRRRFRNSDPARDRPPACGQRAARKTSPRNRRNDRRHDGGHRRPDPAVRSGSSCARNSDKRDDEPSAGAVNSCRARRPDAGQAARGTLARYLSHNQSAVNREAVRWLPRSGPASSIRPQPRRTMRASRTRRRSVGSHDGCIDSPALSRFTSRAFIDQNFACSLVALARPL